MRVCVVGAGAIGGYVAAMLANAGIEVTVIARGAHLAAIQANGLQLVTESEETIVARDVAAFSDMRAAGRHDVVILGVKANQVPPIAQDVNALLREDSVLVTMQNGIPWWYFQRHGGPHDGRHIEAVDPGGAIARTIDPRRIIGTVVYPAATIAAPGVIRHIEGRRFPLGELDGSATARAAAVSGLFTAAGLKAPVLDDIRSEIWLKLWGNLSFNPISALSHATLSDICRYPLTRDVAKNMMLEAQAVAEALGARFRVPLEKRIAGAEKVGEHKTSMLQDVEAGRHVEIDALVGAIIELGTLVGTPTPCIATVYALVKLLSKTIAEKKVVVRTLPVELQHSLESVMSLRDAPAAHTVSASG